MAVTKHSGGGQKPRRLSTGDDRPQHLSVEQAADLLGIHRSTAYRLAAEGELPFDRVGGQLITTKAALRKRYPNVVGGGE